MIVVAEPGHYVFSLTARRRKKPVEKYSGVLRTHRFYINYYILLESQEPSRAITDNEPRVSFPVRFTEVLLDFARELGGSVVKSQKVKIRGESLYYEKPIVVLPNELAFRRHLLFALTASTYRKPSEAKLNTLRDLLLVMNANLLNVLSSMAIDRYKELRASQNPTWHWSMLRVGKAIKVLYKLD